VLPERIIALGMLFALICRMIMMYRRLSADASLGIEEMELAAQVENTP
jgi:hypothetical protein